ncbi:MAG: DUF3833 family protein [Rhizobiaceae bacterium]|nr:DUF3833 family protein [Rhizobiaceae bacterium]
MIRQRPTRRRAIATGFFLLGTLLALGACSEVARLDPNGGFAIESFFDGNARSEGEIETLGLWKTAFTADFKGRAEEDGEFHLDETFHLSVGDRLQYWRLHARPDGRYDGTVRTADEDGLMSPTMPVAGYRTAEGAVLEYDGYAPGGGSMVLHFRHEMTAEPDGTVVNQVKVSKLGLPLATSRVVFMKVTPAG